MNKLDYCFHSHTSRCGHAYGEDEEYVKSAIQGHFKMMGYSDHAMLPHFEQPGMRGSYSLFPNYVSSVREIAKKYEGKIIVRLGMEAEWYGDLYKEYYTSLLERGILDYLILGQHNFIHNGVGYFYSDLRDEEDSLNRYEHDVIEGMESGLFLYFAHPDHYMIWYHDWNDRAIEVANHIIAKAKELGLPLEANMGPSRWRSNGFGEDGEMKVPYPDPRFWDLVSKAGVPVTIGVDAHAPSDYLTSDFSWVMGFIKRHNLHLLTGEEVLARLDSSKAINTQKPQKSVK